MSSGEVVSFRKEWSKTFQYWGGRFPPLKYPKGMVEDISAEYKEEG